jgi:hypothetical protein
MTGTGLMEPVEKSCGHAQREMVTMARDPSSRRSDQHPAVQIEID